MDDKKYVLALCDSYDKINEAIKTSPSTLAVKDLFESYNANLIQNIRGFFSSSEGVGSDIKMVYAKAKNDFMKDYPEMEVLDINKCHALYMEYLSGMKEMIRNEVKSVGEVDETAQQQKIETYKEKDDLFISSLFTGANATVSKTRNLDTSLVNLEVLIDLIPEIEGVSKWVSEMYDGMVDSAIAERKISLVLLKLIVASYADFTKTLIEHIFTTFTTLVNTLENKRPEITPVCEVPKFQLF